MEKRKLRKQPTNSKVRSGKQVLPSCSPKHNNCELFLIGTRKTYELFWFHCNALYNQEEKKKVLQKQSGLILILWNSNSAWRGTNGCFCKKIFFWVVALSSYLVKGIGSSFYFKNARCLNLQQRFWAWVLVYHDILFSGVQYSNHLCSAVLLETLPV